MMVVPTASSTHPPPERPNGPQERITMPQWRHRIAALLLAGLGLVAAMARRRGKPTRT